MSSAMALTVFLEAENADDADVFVGVTKLDRPATGVLLQPHREATPTGPVARSWLRASRRALDQPGPRRGGRS